jgi:hypothetical protein
MKPFVPEIAEMPAQTMALVHTVGDPTELEPVVAAWSDDARAS